MEGSWMLLYDAGVILGNTEHNTAEEDIDSSGKYWNMHLPVVGSFAKRWSMER